MSAPPTSKACSKCKEVKPLEDFPKNEKMKLGADSWCYECRRGLMNANHAADPTKWRKGHLERTYGITIERYNEMLSQQEGECLICRRTPEELKQPFLAVDHSHETGEVRGLLCKGCNLKLGWVERNLLAILKYLKH